jgi:hypothetical protein
MGSMGSTPVTQIPTIFGTRIQALTLTHLSFIFFHISFLSNFVPVFIFFIRQMTSADIPRIYLFSCCKYPSCVQAELAATRPPVPRVTTPFASPWPRHRLQRWGKNYPLTRINPMPGHFQNRPAYSAFSLTVGGD